MMAGEIGEAGGVFLDDGSGRLEAMPEADYLAEAELQKLLADHPSLLAGEQIDAVTPRRWLLVRREMAVADETGSGRWSLDHLFLDQSAIPTLVEVKRSVDSRLRREVVGQMLDYAANAPLTWTAETVRAAFEARCVAEGSDAPAELAAFLDGETEPEGFWDGLRRNLEARRLRLVFVADEIPPELRRIVEFLDEQLELVQVVALEVRRYGAGPRRVLVPRVVAQSARAQQRRAGPRSVGSWTEETFFDRLANDPVRYRAAEALLAWFREQDCVIWWGKGKANGSFVPLLLHKETQHQLCAVYTYGVLEFYFQYYKNKRPFSDREKRLELRSRLTEIKGVTISLDAIERRPSIPLALLADPEKKEKLLHTFGWLIQEIRAS